MPHELCGGNRFTPETLTVTWGSRHIGEVLRMCVIGALELFSAYPKMHRALALTRVVGVGYLTLDRPSPALSGGEAKRLELVTELVKAYPDLARRHPERDRGTGRST